MTYIIIVVLLIALVGHNIWTDRRISRLENVLYKLIKEYSGPSQTSGGTAPRQSMGRKY